MCQRVDVGRAGLTPDGAPKSVAKCQRNSAINFPTSSKNQTTDAHYSTRMASSFAPVGLFRNCLTSGAATSGCEGNGQRTVPARLRLPSSHAVVVAQLKDQCRIHSATSCKYPLPTFLPQARRKFQPKPLRSDDNFQRTPHRTMIAKFQQFSAEFRYARLGQMDDASSCHQMQGFPFPAHPSFRSPRSACKRRHSAAHPPRQARIATAFGFSGPPVALPS